MATDFVNRYALEQLFDYMEVEALFVNSPKNVFYLTGSPNAIPNVHLLPWYDPSGSSSNVALVLRDGHTVLFVAQEDEDVSLEHAFAQVIAFDRTLTTAVDAACHYLSARGLVNIVLGYEPEAIPVSMARRLRANLPAIRLTPIDEALDLVRSMKTPGEVAAMKESARILDEAMIKAFTDTRIGDTEWQLHAAILGNALDLGAEYCRGGLMIVETGREPHGVAGERRIQDGDLIYADHATFLGGYPSNQTRHAVVGQPSEEHRRMYQINIDVQRALIDYMRPGISGREVFQKCRELVAEYGMKHSAVIVGHGLGFGYQERPMITEEETMTLRDGNIIAIEPMLPPTQRYAVQDLVLIREGGNVLLSDRFNTDELFVIDGSN